MTAEEKLHEGRSAPKLHPNGKGMARTLIFAMLMAMLVMAAFEIVKQLLHPDITIWESHLVTIVFSGLAGALAAYYVHQRIEALRQQTIEESTERRAVAEALRRLEGEIVERERAQARLATQFAVTRVLVETPGCEEPTEKLLKTICEGLGWDIGEKWRIDTDSNVLRLDGIWHTALLDAEDFKSVSREMAFSVGQGLPGRVYASTEPAWLPDIITDPTFLRRSVAAQVGLHGSFAFPIKGSSSVIGVMAFFSHEVRQADDDILNMMADIGIRIGQFMDRRQAEAALRQSQEKYRSFFEEDLSGDFLSAPDGKLLACNPAFARIFGFDSVEEAMSYNLGSLYSEAVELESFVDLIRREKKLEYHETTLRRRDGSSVHVIENVVGKFDENGELVEIKGYLFDNTTRKQLEDQLRQSHKMEAVGRLASGIAHDFNNLLTAIIGYSQLLLSRAPQNGPALREVQEIRKAAERAATLTSQLLAFSRKQMIQPQVLDISNIVSGMHRMLRRLISEDIELLTVLDPTLGRVKADQGQIEQVIMNLVVNARDAMPQGGRLIIETANVYLDEAYAHTHISVKPGPYVRITISDTGLGMDPETRAHVFEPFFTTKEIGRGTGLGLSTVYGIVKQSNGNVWVYSEPGHGTTFKIYLPRVEEPTCDSASDVLATSPGGTETVLLVEDEGLVRDLSAHILRGIGYKVLEATNGEEALQQAEKHPGPIHLLLTDVVMPQMGGRELARRVKFFHPETRLLFVSGYTINSFVHHGLLKPDTPFIEKPFTPDNLARKVREVLDK